MEWILGHLSEIALGIMVADKIVTITPTKHDDMILTVIKSIFSGFTKKAK